MKTFPIAFGALLLTTAAVSGCAQPGPGADTAGKDQVVSILHEKITKDRPWYKELPQNKALAGCINWDASTLSNVDIRHHFAYYMDPHTDAPVSLGKLVSSALGECDRRRKQAKSTCECVVIDKNDKPALKVPAEFYEQ